MSTPLIENGRPRYGRFKSPPSFINLEDYKLLSPFNKPLTGMSAILKKKFGFKSFQFISLNNQDVMIGFAVVDLGWVSNGFFYIHNKKTNFTLEISELQPLGRKTTLENPADRANCIFQKSNFRIEIDRKDQVRKVKVSKANLILLEAEIDVAQVEPLALCNPTGATGWTYTQKQTAEEVRGYYLDQGQRVEITPKAGFLAATDDSCGYLSYRTSWHWLSVSATLASGQRVGLNFAMGVNQGFGTENALWIDGKIFEIPPVMFELTDDDEPTWRVYSADRSIDLTVKTGWCRQESLNLGVVASHFNQWVSTVSGTIRCEDQTVMLNGEVGLLEKHFAKW
ncbi:MAG: DUF2804 domain-containing protein [Aquirhabdus sp.]